MRGILSKRQFRCGIILAAFFAVLSTPAPAVAQPDKTDKQAPRLQLVDTSWVLEHLDDPGVVIIDARPPEEYVQGHIAGAVNLSSADTYHVSLKLRVASQSRIQQVLGLRGIRYFKSPSVFEELYKDLVDYDEVILYCNNGC
jgi:3-mercaptopyruvate sulfurtransferase SseA